MISAESGKRLHEHLFGPGYPIEPGGMVGIGSEDFFVYMHMPPEQWRGPRPSEWEGAPIVWHWNAGRPIPLTQVATLPASGDFLK